MQCAAGCLIVERWREARIPEVYDRSKIQVGWADGNADDEESMVLAVCKYNVLCTYDLSRSASAVGSGIVTSFYLRLLHLERLLPSFLRPS